MDSFGKDISIALPDGGGVAASLHAGTTSDGDASKSRRPRGVLLLHGLGGTRHEHNGNFIRLAADLAATGLTVLRIDFRGCGESSGEPGSFTISSMIEDAKAAARYLFDEMRVESLDLLGFSLGGTIAPLAAAAMIDRYPTIRSVIMWQTSFDLLADLKAIFGPLALTRVRPRKSLANIRLGLITLSQVFTEELQTAPQMIGDTLDKLALRIPLLIVRSQNDEVVARRPHQYQWHEPVGALDIEQWVIADADHGLSQTAHLIEAIRHTRDFLARLT